MSSALLLVGEVVEMIFGWVVWVVWVFFEPMHQMHCSLGCRHGLVVGLGLGLVGLVGALGALGALVASAKESRHVWT